MTNNVAWNAGRRCKASLGQMQAQRQILARVMQEGADQLHEISIGPTQVMPDSDEELDSPLRLPGLVSAHSKSNYDSPQPFVRLARNLHDTRAFYDCIKLPAICTRGSMPSSRGDPEEEQWHVILLADPAQAGGPPHHSGGSVFGAPTLAGVVPSREHQHRLPGGGPGLHSVTMLQQVLGLESNVVLEMLQQLKSHGYVVAEKCESRRAAVQRACALRDRGLQARITKQPNKDRSPKARRGRVEGFAKLCRGTVRGTLLSLADKMESNAFSRSKAHTARGHSERVWGRANEATPGNDRLFEDAVVEDAWHSEDSSGSKAVLSREVTMGAEEMSQVQTSQAEAQSEAEVAAPFPPSARRPSNGAFLASREVALPPALREQALSPARRERVLSPAQQHTLSPIRVLPDYRKMWREASSHRAVNGWDVAMLAALNSKKGASAQTAIKLACRLMHVFVFGRWGPKGADGLPDEEAIFKKAIGSKEEVETLFCMWVDFDVRRAGRVDCQEFRKYVHKHVKGALGDGQAYFRAASEDFTHSLCSKIEERLLLQRKTTVSIEDFMRLLWPAATLNELKQMKFWCRGFEDIMDRAKIRPPAVLPKEEFDALCAIFHHTDRRKSGHVVFEKLVSDGIIHDYQQEQLKRDWDQHGNGKLDVLSFCEMMCPAGYRAHRLAEIGTASDGRIVVYDRGLRCWVERDNPSDGALIS